MRLFITALACLISASVVGQDCSGCTNPDAVNFNPYATEDNGSCIIQTGGCTMPFACNYDPTADYYLPGSCDFSCLFGMPMGGACADPLACNYGEDEPCVFLDENGEICAQGGCNSFNVTSRKRLF